jgi:hypothetical protein
MDQLAVGHYHTLVLHQHCQNIEFGGSQGNFLTGKGDSVAGNV